MNAINIAYPGLRDRRPAASDETVATNTGRIYFNRAIRGEGRVVSHADAQGAGVGPDRAPSDRAASEIHTVVLHVTNGAHFVLGTHLIVGDTVIFRPSERQRPPRQARAIPDESEDSNPASYTLLDQIAAHFVVTRDGMVFYTHDMSYWIQSAGGRGGIDIEFVGYRHSISRTPPRNPAQRATAAQITAGRRLLYHLRQRLPSLIYVHPHGQIQTYDDQGQCGGTTGNDCDKRRSCCGPDIWVNVGRWAAVNLPRIQRRPFHTARPHHCYPNHGNHQDIDAYDQGIDGY